MDWTLVVSIVIPAIPATIAAVYGYLNHRDRVQSQPPHISILRLMPDKNSYVVQFRVLPTTRHPAPRGASLPNSDRLVHEWLITGIEVEGFRRKRCLSTAVDGDVSEWSNAIHYDPPVKGGRLRMHPDCSEVCLSFTCKMSSSSPLKKKRVQYNRPAL